ncbi:unnamed protein product [Heligmosomoides polygyrus]|uniref:Endo/exonuclease/phosphatase domain-containing protein n=1 Tax=Heligmosomoides polygyrus TaxID=6339 RepID=A0A183GXD3_HELPZ|nr:unnamed protein product [Heligmosomoides polygyrus]
MLRKLRTRMTICTYNARTLALEASVEDLMMQARKIKYDVIGLTETRRHHILHADDDSGEELFLGTCDSRGVGGVGVLVNTHLAMNIDSAPTSDYDDEDVEAFYVELEKFYKEDHTSYKVIVDFHAKIGPRRSPEELHIGTHGLEWNEQGERLSYSSCSVHHLRDSAKLAESLKTAKRRLSP